MSFFPSWFKAPAVIGAMALSAFTPSAKAELDYEFAKSLMSQKSPSFNTDDLVERLIAKLEESGSPQQKLEAKLIRATHKRNLAADANTPQKKAELLDEALKIFTEINGSPDAARFRLADTVKGETPILTKQTIKAKMELVKDNKTEGKRLADEAVAILEREVSVHKAAAEAAKGQFDPAFKAYKDFMEKVDPNLENPPPPPRNIVEPVERTFDVWILADKKYVLARVEQIDCYLDTDPQKKEAVKQITELCQTRVDDEAVSNFPLIVSWYSLMQGRAFAHIQDEEKAGEAWRAALNAEGQEHMSPGQKQQLLNYKKVIIRELVKMKMKAAESGKPGADKKYADVEEIIAPLFTDREVGTFFNEDAGKDLLCDYARAMVRQPDATSTEFEKALKKLGEAVEKERKPGGNPQWANQFSATMADVLDEARKAGIRPRLPATDWYNAARGYFLIGQYEYSNLEKMDKKPGSTQVAPTDLEKKYADVEGAKKQFEKAYTEYQNAVDFYRRAISVARNAERTDLVTRVLIEPKAWTEMGLCYIKMGHYYEAIISYTAMRDTFASDARVKWLPKSNAPELRKVWPTIEATLKELDAKDTGLIGKSGKNIVYALDTNLIIHNDKWNKGLKPRILLEEGPGMAQDEPGAQNDPKYLAAKTVMEDANARSANAKKDPAQAQRLYTEAGERFLKAAEMFLKDLDPKSDAREAALYQAAVCYTQAQGLWSTGKIPFTAVNPPKDKVAEETKKQLEVKVRDLAQKAIKCFDDYTAWVASHEPKTEQEKAIRPKLEGIVLLSRSNLYTGMEDWPKTVTAADAYIKWEQSQEKVANPAENVALLNKFKALLELAATKIVDGKPEAVMPPECDPFLKDAETTANRYRTVKPKDTMTFQFMLAAMDERYVKASFRTQDKDLLNKYNRKVAQLHGERVKIAEAEKTATIDAYTRLVYLYDKARMQKEAADVGIKLLGKFDTDNRNMQLPPEEYMKAGFTKKMGESGEKIEDDWKKQLNSKMSMKEKLEEEFWGQFADDMVKSINYDETSKRDNCRNDHRALVDYLFDTRVGVANKANKDRRPANDKLNVNLEEALAKIATIQANYPDCATIAPKSGALTSEALSKKYPLAAGHYPLDLIAEEVKFRRKVEATRDQLVVLAKNVAIDATTKNNESEAGKYRQVASDQLAILSNLRGSTPGIQIEMASLLVSNGKYDEALDQLISVRDSAPPGSELYFNASFEVSKVYYLQKKWKDALEYPEFVTITMGPDSAPVEKYWKDPRWKDMRTYMDEMYKAGNITPPEAVQKALSGEKKPDAPKPEAKSDAAAAPTPAEKKPE